MTLPDSEDPLVIAADPTDPDDLYIMSDVYQLSKLTWPSGVATGIPYPLDSDNAYIANVLVTTAGTLLVSYIGYDDPDEVMNIYRSTDGGANWTTIDLYTEMPYSWWDDTLQISECSDGTLAMVLSSGKCLFSTDDGASWSATAILAPTETTILSVEAV
jgi:hypothetical protein